MTWITCNNTDCSRNKDETCGRMNIVLDFRKEKLDICMMYGRQRKKRDGL